MRTCIALTLIFCCSVAAESDESAPTKRRYLLYDCNPGEGFNLRRDVYIRMSNLVKDLRTENGDQDWVLVLPPWGRIRYHWREQEYEQSKIAWQHFFDIESLKYHIPVMEFEDYVEEIGEPKVEEIWYLQGSAMVQKGLGKTKRLRTADLDHANPDLKWFNSVIRRPSDAFKDGKFVETVREEECNDPPVYESDDRGKIRGWFWGYHETYAHKFKCVSVLGSAKILIKPLSGENTTAQSVFLDRGESVMHDVFGGKDYWDSRRSMVFSSQLKQEAAKFRSEYLDSDDEKDNTHRPTDWRTPKIEPGTAKGGPYIGAHMRRKDFLYARKDAVPTIETTAKRLKELMVKHEVKKIFVASDGTEEEKNELKRLVPEIVMYEPSEETEKKLKKGGVAIVDQIICSHAKYFIGTKESTFSFRIQEEREIMGFERDMTFNRICGQGEEDDCEQPSRWKISWESDREIWQ